MTSLHQLLASRFFNMAGGGFLSALWLFFAIAHLSNFLSTGRISLLVFCLAESVIAAFLLLRSQPKSFSTDWREWLAAMSGTFLILLLRPVAETPPAAAEWGLTLGALILLAGAFSLNRSFAMVPALRELKTNGMYRFVRHPIYFSYLLTFTFYLAGNFSLRNLAIVLGNIALLLLRVRFEERHLRQSPQYREYCERVRWRLIPFIL